MKANNSHNERTAQCLDLSHNDKRKIYRLRKRIRENKNFWTDLYPKDWHGQGIHIRGVAADRYDSYGIWASMHGGGYCARIATLWSGQWAYTLRRRLQDNKSVLYTLLKPLIGESPIRYIPQQGMSAYAAGGLEYMYKVLSKDTKRICNQLANVFSVSPAIVSQSLLDPDLYFIGNDRKVYVLTGGDAYDRFLEFKYAGQTKDFFDFELCLFDNYFCFETPKANASKLFPDEDLIVYSADGVCEIPKGDNNDTR